jgi:hypothetical protein
MKEWWRRTCFPGAARRNPRRRLEIGNWNSRRGCVPRRTVGFYLLRISFFFFVVKAVPVMHGHSLSLGVSPSHTALAQCRGDLCHGRNEAVDMQYEEMRNCRGDSRTMGASAPARQRA